MENIQIHEVLKVMCECMGSPANKETHAGSILCEILDCCLSDL